MTATIFFSHTRKNSWANYKMEQKAEQDQDTSYVTMPDILQEQEELEETSRAVLGGSDEKNCTYTKVGGVECVNSWPRGKSVTLALFVSLSHRDTLAGKHCTPV